MGSSEWVISEWEVLNSKEYFGIIQGSDVFAADCNFSVLSRKKSVVAIENLSCKRIIDNWDLLGNL